jgi:hypothetical protein
VRHLLLVLSFALALPCLCVQAQTRKSDSIELYATFDVAHASSIPAGVTLSANGAQTQYTGLTLPSLGGGVSLNVLRLPVFSLALDFHGATHHGVAAANALETATFGLRLAAQPPHTRLRPWIEGAAGLLDAHTPNGSSPGAPQYGGPNYASHYAIYTGTAGLDYRFARHFDLRMLDVSGGASFGAAPSVTVWSAESGIILHF